MTMLPHVSGDFGQFSRLCAVLSDLSPGQFGEAYYSLTRRVPAGSHAETGAHYPGLEDELLSIMRPIVGHEFPNIKSFVELGPGSAISVKDRSMPLVETLGCPAYVGVDICDDSLLAAKEVFRRHQPHVRITTLQSDFLRGSIKLDAEYPRGVYIGGSTIGNLPGGHIDRFPQVAYRNLFFRLRTLVGVGGFLLIGWHAADAQGEALAPYSDAGALDLLNMPLRNLAALGGIGFDSENWQPAPVWHPGSRCVSHGFVARRDCKPSFANETYVFDQGDRLVFNVSFKISLEVMLALAERVGFTSICSLHQDAYRLLLLAA